MLCLEIVLCALVNMISILFLEKLKRGKCVTNLNLKCISLTCARKSYSGKEVAVIYGGLPPGTKLAQAAKFNDPANSCKVMVATDAIGMGLNL